ncbi:MAG: Uma2 family endonuclease [Polyangiaceae bacterium]
MPPASPPPDRVRPLRRAEYDRLVSLGAFAGEKLELLGGRLVTMSPHGEPHAFSITRLTKRLVHGLGDRADVRVQLPLALSDVSEPEPDLAVVAPGDYLDEHPLHALLVIEVASTSLDEDRRVKGALYAAAGIVEYWIVNLVGGVVEVHREPSGAAYASVEACPRGAVLRVPGFEDVLVRVDEILPPA